MGDRRWGDGPETRSQQFPVRPKAPATPGPEATGAQAGPHGAPRVGGGWGLTAEKLDPRTGRAATAGSSPGCPPTLARSTPAATCGAPALPPRTLAHRQGREPVLRGGLPRSPREGRGAGGPSLAAPTHPLAAPGSQQLTATGDCR